MGQSPIELRQVVYEEYMVLGARLWKSMKEVEEDYLLLCEGQSESERENLKKFMFSEQMIKEVEQQAEFALRLRQHTDAQEALERDVAIRDNMRGRTSSVEEQTEISLFWKVTLGVCLLSIIYNFPSQVAVGSLVVLVFVLT